MSLNEDANYRYPRLLRAVLERDLAIYPAVAVMGARQVGKSTLCREIAAKRGWAYRTLDDRDVREQALEDPEGLLESLGEVGAVIDEVQRAPELFLALKAVIDRQQRPGQYLLSGSNQPRMSSAVGESLQGRAAYRTLRPLTLSEQRLGESQRGWEFLLGENEKTLLDGLAERAAASGALDWKQVVKSGGFPRALAAPPDARARMLDDYTKTFAHRDVRDVLGIESTERFEDFFRLAAVRTGQPLNAHGLANELGIPATTARRWVEALSRSYLIELVPAYSRSANQRVVQARKLFLLDPALALAAARENEPSGFHLETLVASDLNVWRDNAPGRMVYHWRAASGQEVDFVVEDGGLLLPVEIKASTSVGTGDARHLRKFREDHGEARRGLILSGDSEIRVLSPGIIAAPWWAVL